MLTKAQRHDRIARLVQGQTIYSQQELQDLLAKSGIEVTQATLSRDLAAMGVLKGPSGYVLPSQAAAVAAVPGDTAEALLQRTLRREMRSIDVGGSLVIIRTDAGHANVLAVELDRARPDEVLGSIAGDDTIFLATRGTSAASKLARRLKTLVENN
jgi:transcriptional regulator of arginine metabolism